MAATSGPGQCSSHGTESLHHLVADAPWNDEEVLGASKYDSRCFPPCRRMARWWRGSWMTPVSPKQGKHSVGVARQYCGQIGKHDNSQAAVSLSVSTWRYESSHRLAAVSAGGVVQDPERRQKAGIPEGIEFQTKPAMALEQMRQAIVQKVPVGSGPGGCSLMGTVRNSMPPSQRTGIANTR